MRALLGVLIVAMVLTASPGWIGRTVAADDPFAALVGHDAVYAGHQLDAVARSLSTSKYPSTTATNGTWTTTGSGDWTSGFFPGSLWQMYEITGDPIWMTRAIDWQKGLEGRKNDTSTHDVGFVIFSSFGKGVQLTGTDAYRQVVLTAAGSLATRYNAKVGCIRSWDGGSSDFKVIIDNMMNLEILFWASKHGGSSTWYDMAVSHALRTMTEHVRADGSTYQVVNYDPKTGAVKAKSTNQGAGTESTWSRGQAWAIHGFTMAYRETGDQRFLDTARRTADYFIQHSPADRVPYWDFEAPGIPNEPRDSSAGAVAAAGLLELGRLESDPGRGRHLHRSGQRDRHVAVVLGVPVRGHRQPGDPAPWHPEQARRQVRPRFDLRRLLLPAMRCSGRRRLSDGSRTARPASRSSARASSQGRPRPGHA